MEAGSIRNSSCVEDVQLMCCCHRVGEDRDRRSYTTCPQKISSAAIKECDPCWPTRRRTRPGPTLQLPRPAFRKIPPTPRLTKNSLSTVVLVGSCKQEVPTSTGRQRNSQQHRGQRECRQFQIIHLHHDSRRFPPTARSVVCAVR